MKNYEAINLYKFLMSEKGLSLKWDFPSTRKLRTILSSLGDLFSDVSKLEAEKDMSNPTLDAFTKALIKRIDKYLVKDENNKIVYNNKGEPLAEEKYSDQIQAERKKVASYKKYKEAVQTRDRLENEWLDILNAEIDFSLDLIDRSGMASDLKLSNLNWDMIELILVKES